MRHDILLLTLLVFLPGFSNLPAAKASAAGGATENSVLVREAKTVKAAYIYNLAKFVDWRADGESPPADAPILICIFGNDAVSSVIDQIATLRAKGRPISVRHLSEQEPVPSCHILYIAASHHDRIPQLMPRIPDGVLTVSDIPNFAETHGIVGFTEADRRVLIEINVRRAQIAGLKFSSKLLEISRIVPRERS